MKRTLRILTLALVLALAVPSVAGATKRLVIRGGGFGHGVGMSQYGAMGYATHGWDHRRILAHYYTGTALTTLNTEQTARVLLQSSSGSTFFSGASSAAGRSISPAKTFSVRARAGGQLELRNAAGDSLATVGAPLRATGPGLLVLKGEPGSGTYRGAFEFRPGTFGGVNTINAVSLEDYVRGVVPLESPASWPIEALKAQAVAARTYALTSDKGGDGFEHYPDTRSQVYGGASVETNSTNAATQATAGEVVTYDGTPVTTYFFSTSGGRTENVENTSLGTSPLPWLKSVRDRYDNVSPVHRWGPIKMRARAAKRKLSGLVKGRFRRIDVVERGRSPRIDVADIVGSRGRTRVSGDTLRFRFGLRDTWAFFRTIRSRRIPVNDQTGGTGSSASSAVQGIAGIGGSVAPAARRARVMLERRTGRRWLAIAATTTHGQGSYRFTVSSPGSYRVRYADATGAPVRIR